MSLSVLAPPPFLGALLVSGLLKVVSWNDKLGFKDEFTTTGNLGPSVFEGEEVTEIALVTMTGTRAEYVMEDRAMIPKKCMENFMRAGWFRR
jgi:hypothetical protein